MTSYKLLIIDDEPIIRQGLRSIIDWSSFGIDIVGEADNGIDGLYMCEAYQPEVVIVDIKMPGMDGLKLIEAARQKGLTSDFLVLSGFSEFTYAQKAVECGVRSFLLKPIDPRALTTRIGKLREEWEQRSYETKRQQHIQIMEAEYELQSCLQAGTIPEPGQEAYDKLAERLGLPWEAYHIALIGDERGVIDTAELNGLRMLLNEQCFEKEGKGSLFLYGSYVCVLTDKRLPSAALDRCLEQAERQYGLQLIIADSPPVFGFIELKGSLAHVSGKMKHKFFCSRSGRYVLDGNDITEPDSSREPFTRHPRAEELAQAVASGCAEHIIALLDDMERDLGQSGWGEQAVKAAVISLYVELIARLTAIEERMRTICPSLYEFASMVEKQFTLAHIREYMEPLLLRWIEEWRKGRKNEGFAAMLDYIAEHCDSDLKLESLAEQFHYNKSYLGKMFKAQTGENFGIYLDRIRMDKAKRLLAGGARVYEAANLVGYASVDYFHMKFKKWVGESPSAYREKWKPQPNDVMLK